MKEVHYIDEYGIDRGVGTIFSYKLWAPVNCGHYDDTNDGRKAGNFYQWGRKDGQLNTGDVVILNTYQDNNENLPDKEKFYSGSSERSYSWTNTEERTWKNDPCPDGWRVPTQSEFQSLGTNYSSLPGINVTGCMKLRYSQSDRRGTIGDAQFYWTSTEANEHNAMVYNNSVYQSWCKGTGAKIRCIKK